MIKEKASKTVNRNTSESVSNIVNSVSGVYFEYKLDDILKKRGMTQRKLSMLTGIRQATISDLIQGKSVLINKSHLLALMITLRITDINDLISVKFPADVEAQFKEESKHWDKTKELPREVLDMAIKTLHSI